jgi:hypothetical protein
MGMEKERASWTDLKDRKHEATLERFVIKIPDHYGSIFSIGGGEVWCVDTEGNLRNVTYSADLVKIIPGAR